MRCIHQQLGHIAKYDRRTSAHQEQPQFIDKAIASESSYQKTNARCKTEQSVEFRKRSVWSAIHDNLPTISPSSISNVFRADCADWCNLNEIRTISSHACAGHLHCFPPATAHSEVTLCIQVGGISGQNRPWAANAVRSAAALMKLDAEDVLQVWPVSTRLNSSGAGISTPQKNCTPIRMPCLHTMPQRRRSFSEATVRTKTCGIVELSTKSKPAPPLEMSTNRQGIEVEPS